MIYQTAPSLGSSENKSRPDMKSKDKRDRAYDDCKRLQFAVGVEYGMRIVPH